MKKHFLFLAMAVAAMTSCMKDEVIATYEPTPQAIGFESFVNKATKAIGSTDTPTISNGLEKFYVHGNYGSTLELRIKECDTVIFLYYPLEICLEGIRERRGKERTDMPWFEAEDEEDEEFMEFVRNYHAQNRPQVMELLEKYSDKNIIVFKNREEASMFLEKMQVV